MNTDTYVTLWIVGRQKSGKTHVSRSLVEFLNENDTFNEVPTAKVVHIGQMLRSKYTEEQFKLDSNPYAVTFAEQEVIGMLYEAIVDMKRKDSSPFLIIDSAPRSEGQNSVLKYSVTQNYSFNLVVFLDEDEEVRIRRADESGQDSEYTLKRESQESVSIFETETFCRENEIPFIHRNSSQAEYLLTRLLG